MDQKILVVDDEANLVETIAFNLEQSGYRVTTAADGSSALEAAHHVTPDLIILDIMLPGIDGLDVCRQLRREHQTMTTPIIMLTAKGEEIDKVVGLEVGADDYVTKPFGRRELMARVRAHLRRAALPPSGGMDGSPSPSRRALVVGSVIIDLDGRRVECRGQAVELQPKLFDLLVFLAHNCGIVLKRDQLLNHVWGYDYDGGSRTVDVHVRWLRKKLEEDPAKPKLIQTVRGVGYVIREEKGDEVEKQCFTAI